MSTAIVMYGPPAAGKDTVTSALAEADPKFRHYQRLKVGPGRAAGYRIGSADDLAQLVAAGDVIYANQRYGATYVIDRSELAALLDAGDTPVLHVGQPEAIDALLTAVPTVRWVIVELWCPRDVAAARSAARGTNDTAARLAAWDATPRLATADIRVDTSTVDPVSAARRITETVQAAHCTIVVPAMHLVREAGTLDLAATRRYAAAAGRGWTDFYLLNGSTTSGHNLSGDERAAVLDVWLSAVDPARLLACSWSPNDIRAAADRQVTPMAVLNAADRSSAEQFLRNLPAGSTIYSHPMFGGQVFTPDLAAWAQAAGLLPLGGKLAKVSLGEITEMHDIAPDFAVWDGSSRHIRQSIDAGAAGVVATPLAATLLNLPPRNIAGIQSTVDAIQIELDQLPDRAAKRAWILDQIHKEHA
ncbi:hypothetical protein [Nocardia sp. NPDC051463]|uniref:hypothetical protein n=1 Tax=Nocardia sp. NPDC051463 TaxID=3154845 RepID=UPI00344E9E1E